MYSVLFFKCLYVYIFYGNMYIMPIADILELRHTSNAGLYAISPEPPSKKKTSFKAGRSVNIKKRLNDYHMCFNEGYFFIVFSH